MKKKLRFDSAVIFELLSTGYTDAVKVFEALQKVLRDSWKTMEVLKSSKMSLKENIRKSLAHKTTIEILKDFNVINVLEIMEEAIEADNTAVHIAKTIFSTLGKLKHCKNLYRISDSAETFMKSVQNAPESMLDTKSAIDQVTNVLQKLLESPNEVIKLNEFRTALEKILKTLESYTAIVHKLLKEVADSFKVIDKQIYDTESVSIESAKVINNSFKKIISEYTLVFSKATQSIKKVIEEL